MRKIAFPLLALFIFALPAEAQTSKTRLYGRWLAEYLTTSDGEKEPIPIGTRIIFEFKRDGSLIAVMSINGESDTKTGTWKIKGKTLELTVDGTTDKVGFKVTAKRLEIINRENKEVLTFRKL